MEGQRLAVAVSAGMVSCVAVGVLGLIEIGLMMLFFGLLMLILMLLAPEMKKEYRIEGLDPNGEDLTVWNDET
jgi:hypothetical protein